MAGSQSIQTVVVRKLCTGCGTCAGLCPQQAIQLQMEPKAGIYVPVVSEDKCNRCGDCLSVCPGHSIELAEMNLKLFGAELTDNVVGNFLSIYMGHAGDQTVRHSSSSGGLVTALLIFALEEKFIDGALVTRMSADDPLRPEPFIARTPEEVVLAARSKYCPVPANIALNRIAAEKGRFAVVGLPCHIHGIRKAEAKCPELKDKIVLHLGLLCSHEDSFLMTRFILRSLGVSHQSVQKIDYRGEGWPGSMSIVLSDGGRIRLPYLKYAVWHQSDMFTPSRCLTCCDTLNKLADVSFGDPWLPGFHDEAGVSIAVARTAEGNDLLRRAASGGYIHLSELPADKIAQWRPSAFRIRRAAAAMSLRRISGRAVPSYGLRLPKPGLFGYAAAVTFYCATCLGRQRWLWGQIARAQPAVEVLMGLSP